MPKKSYTYLEVDPYKIIEKGFHREVILMESMIMLLKKLQMPIKA